MMRRAIAAATAGLFLALSGAASAIADPVRDAQWHLDFLDVAAAHELSRGEGVVVAVIDTGVDAGHPDLAGKVLDGVNLLGDDADALGHTDFDGHGTKMAGVIAAEGRALGIAPGARIVPVRATNTIVGVYDTAAIDWVIAHGADIICYAASGPDGDPFLRERIEQALAADIVVVAAAGNTPDDDAVGYPAAYPGVIAAVGVDEDGNHAEISVTGRQAVLAAPATRIHSTTTRFGGEDGYSTGSGTSDATAIIAGAAALVRSRFPELSAAEVVHRLTATADDRGAPGRDPEYGYGIVNLVRALTEDVPPLTPTPQPVTEPTASSAIAGPPDDGGPSTTVIALGALVLAVIVGATITTFAVLRRRQS